ncbi:carboxyl-terminal peptidase [Trifolium medium]|uniref:Carboxyl-terminal peptidase n=2 Tax=Trifolium medium TaxID=97028 RepID=A0A392MM67_9FABA|nr:carboxyl-terminal peptidase [Trifolium medium]MCH88962.1 carboxyl-terminal peptidase [Trifolium medium]
MSTGCFDLTCHGFVQTNKNIVLGGTIGPISIPFHQQYELNYGIFRDNEGKWWLKVKNSIAVGYWPGELIPNLGTAKLVQWGGQVFSHEVKTKPPHTGTQMGSGDEANNRFGRACYISNVRIKDNSQMLKYPQFVSTYAREPYCYGALNDAPYGKDPIFYFGGPGRNPPYCP